MLLITELNQDDVKYSSEEIVNEATGASYGRSETIDYVNIIGTKFSTNGSIAIARGANPLMTLFNTGDFNFQMDGMSVSDFNTNNLAITVTSTGTLVLNVSKKSRQWANSQWTI